MWRSLMASSLRILDHRVCEDVVPEVPAQVAQRAHVDTAAAYAGRQLAFHGCQAEQARHVVGLEFDKDVDVARRPEIVSQNGPEERQTPNVVPQAEFADLAIR
jgi:hypothetical protein